MDAIELEVMPDVQHQCPQCGSPRLREDLVKSAFWQGERLVIVEDIPAVVCEACGERFYDDATAMTLDLMQGDGYPSGQAREHMHVPIFSFSARVPVDLISVAEEQP